MTPFSNNGTIRQEDIQSRNIARQRIAQAIAKEAQRTELLVDIVIDQVGKNRQNSRSVDSLWDDIQMDGELRAIRLKAEANVSDYPGFSGWLNGLCQHSWFSSCLRLTLPSLPPLLLGN